MKDFRLSENLWLSEITYSKTAVKRKILNSIEFTNENIKALFHLAFVFEIVRRACGGPLKVTSGFRSKKLNRAVGGAKQSKHQFLKALDLRCPKYLTKNQFENAIKGLRKTNLVTYYYWNSSRSIHISF